MVIRYGVDGEVKWATSIGGDSYDYVNSVISTRDGGILVGGHFQSSSVTVGDYTIKKVGYYDGIVIKYGADNEVKWVTSIGGSEGEYIESVLE